MYSPLRHYLVLFAALATFTTLPLTGCNTIEGAGEDITEAGQAVDNAAE